MGFMHPEFYPNREVSLALFVFVVAEESRVLSFEDTM